MKKANEMVVVPTAELLSEMEALEIVGGRGSNNTDEANGNCPCYGHCGCTIQDDKKCGAISYSGAQCQCS